MPPQIVDESDLEPIAEGDLESASETAGARRTNIAETPLPETQRPPLWNPKSRAAMRFTTGVAIPTIAAAPFTGGASILAGMGGAAGAEALDYAMSPEEERPSLLGAGSRVAAQGAIPLALGKIGQKLAPLLTKIPITQAVPEAASQVAQAGLGAGIERAVGEAGGLAARAGKKTAESELRSLLLKDLEHYSPGIQADEVADVFRNWFGDPNKALANRALEMARDRFNQIADDIVNEAEHTSGIIKLTRLEEMLQNFGKEAFSKTEAAARPAFKQARNALSKVMGDFLETTHGAEAAGQFRQLTRAIRIRLDVAEGLGEEVMKNPINTVKRLLGNPQGRQLVQAFDHINGTQFGPALDKIAVQVNAVSAAKVAATATRATAAGIRVAQNEARNFLKGLIVASATAGGAAQGGSIGGLGGFMLGLLAGRMKGAIPLEKLAAGAAVGAAKAAPIATAAGGKTAEAIFSREKPGPEAPAIAESDLEESP